MGGVTSRLFPYFRDPENGHNGFLFISLLVQLAGFLLFMLGYYAFKEILIETNLEKSRLVADYVYLLVPLTFFLLLFSFLDSYNRILYNVVLGTFLQEFFQRLLILISVVLFAIGLLTLNQLIITYAIAVCMKGVVLLIYLFFKGEINLRPKPDFISEQLRKEIIGVAFFSLSGEWAH